MAEVPERPFSAMLVDPLPLKALPLGPVLRGFQRNRGSISNALEQCDDWSTAFKKRGLQPGNQAGHCFPFSHRLQRPKRGVFARVLLVESKVAGPRQPRIRFMQQGTTLAMTGDWLPIS